MLSAKKYIDGFTSRIFEKRKARALRTASRTRRRLGLLEQLEDRRLLALLTPGNVAELIANINTANANGENDTIDLGGQTFTLSQVDNSDSVFGSGANGLPRLLSDGGHRLTIQDGAIVRDQSQGSPQFRLLEVTSGADVQIVNLTLTGGQTVNGGGVLNSGRMNFIGSTVSQNSATLHGGGIFNSGRLTLSDTTLVGNDADLDGGGIESEQGRLSVVNSTLSGNVAGRNGGAIDVLGGTQAIVSQSTIAGNSASGDGAFFINNGSLAIQNTLLSGNTGGDGSIINGGTISGSNNLADDASFPGRIAAVTNFEPTLADNGGPTLTHAILAGSNAIDMGDNALAINPGADAMIGGGDDTPLATDQRGTGFARILFGTVDIGAFEAPEAPSLVVTTDQDVTDNTDGLTSLREAIAFANLTPNTLDEITFGGDGTGGTTNFTDGTADIITLGGTQLGISSDLTITGPGSDLLTVSGDDSSRVFNIADGDHDVTFDSLSIADGRRSSSTDGAGIQNNSHGQILITDTVLTSNVGGSGAAVSSQDGDLTVRDSQFIDNQSAAGGAAITVTHNPNFATAPATHVIIERTTFRENRSTNDVNGGGGVLLNSVNGGQMTAIIADSTFVDNIGAGDAGALWNRIPDIGTLTTIVTNSTFSGNSALRGGAIQNQGTLTLVNSTVVNNDATGGASPDGGGILTTNTNLTLVNSIVAGNTTGGATPDDISGTIDTTNSASNIVGDAGSAGGLTDGTNNNQVSVLITDVIDTTLADNGGPTLTHALIAGSPAINAGDNALATGDGTTGGTQLSTDQRGTGFARILNGTVDIGAFEGFVEAPSLVVTTASDVVDNTDFLTSLREAIAFANLTPDTLDEITFGGDGTGGTTNFTDAIPDVITLGGTQLTISSDITINGPSADLLTVSGDDASRVFNIANGDHDVTFDSLTIADGFTNTVADGAGILNTSSGMIQLLNGAVVDNTSGSDGGGILSSNGTLLIRDSRFAGNSSHAFGGAIRVNAIGISSTLVVERSTFENNTSTLNGSGGIHLNAVNSGSITATISDSTFVGNTASTSPSGLGGAIENRQFGSGSAVTTIINSTFSGNSARRGGAIYNNEGTLTVINSTVVNNDATGGASPGGGGILTTNTNLTLVNSIVAGNTTGGATPDDISGTIDTTNSASNIVGDAGSAGGLTDGTNNNQVSVLITDVIHTTLADNGGPTLTHALIAGSPAINAGDNALATGDGTTGGTQLSTDQRGTGFARILNGTVDIGAFEGFVEAPSLVVTTASDVVDNTDFLTSLREAIAFANLTPDTLDEITFGGDGTGGTTNFTDATPDTITLGGTQLDISSDITISGPGSDLLTVSGNNASRVFDIAGGDHDVTLDSLTIAEGNTGYGDGGGIRNRSTGTVTISDAVVSDSRGQDGAGIYQENGTLHLERTTVRDNKATFGGGMLIDGGNVSLVDSWVASNTAEGHNSAGGGIRVYAGTLTVVGSTISGNRIENVGLPDYGGGMSIRSAGTVVIINSTVSGNRGGAGGGGINSNGSLTMVNSTVTGNTAVNGGGIARGIGTTTIINSIVAGNTATIGTAPDVWGTFVGDANNLIGDTTDSTGFTGSDITAVDVTTVIDTTLADNGGPTPTHALITGSPAIDAGDNDLSTEDGTATGNALTTDQRGTGFDRIVGGTVDIGAFEAATPATADVNLSLSSNVGSEAGETVITVIATADAVVSAEQTVTVNVTGIGITSDDFDQLTATITIAAGSNTGTADFTIENDTLVEPTETATFNLSNPSAGLTLGATTSGTVAITDNDSYDTEVTLVSGVLTIQDINGGTSNDDLTLSYAAGTYTLTDNGGLTINAPIAGATGDGTSTVTFSGTDVTGIVFDTLGGDDTITVDSVQAALSGGFTITGGTGFDRAVVNGTIATTGIGAVNITTSGPIVLNSGSSVTTVNGGITLNANSAGAQTARFIGLDANNALIQTTGTGNIQLLGHGAATDSGTSDLYGVDLRGGTRVRSTATGSSAGMITITGSGGNAASNNFGVRILGSTTNVSSVDGDILITGAGGNGSSLYNHGILASGGRIESTGAGENAASIIITGTGGRGPTEDDGVRINGFQVSSVAGEITITGTGNGEAPDFRASGASIIGGGTATGAITINANSIALQGTTNVQSTAALTIRPRTAGTTIGIGGGTGDLNLDDTELGMLSDGFSSITIGDASSGDIDINTATFHDALNLITGGEVHDLTGADLNMSGGDTVTVDGTVAPGQSPGILSVTGNFAFADNSTYEVEINGNSPGTSYDQIDATGAVSIGSGVALDLGGLAGFVGSRVGGESFKIINRTGGTGTFDGLPEGATISNFFSGDGGRAPLDATITYQGGDGDDVVLTVIHPEADLSVTVDDGQTTAIPGDPVTYTIFVTNDGPYFGSLLSILSTLPASLTGVSVASITPTGGTSGITDNSSGNELDIDVVKMPVSGTLTITVTGTIDPGVTGSLDVTVNVPYPNDPVTGNNTATDTNTIASAETPSLVVTTDADIEDEFDGLTSLREAIAFANSNPDASTITFGGDGTGGTTNFTDAIPDVITLGGTELTISSDITINGPSADLLTVSGDDASRVFNIANGDHDVTFDSLTIADGKTDHLNRDGAGIRSNSHGQISITNAVLSSNAGVESGAVSSLDGDLTVRDSQFIDNQSDGLGAAITVTHNPNFATVPATHVIIERTTFRENRSTNNVTGGGGVVLNSVNGGQMTAIIADSTFVDNIGAGDAGALWNRIPDIGTLTTIVTNSTFSGNSARRGGAIQNLGTLTLVNSTVVNNDATGGASPDGGGILTTNTNLTLVNSIVAGNTTGGATPDDISGTIDTTNSASNIVGDAGSAGGLTDGTNNNQVSVLITDVIDTTLANNGGPTLTHALIAGSPAINAGDNALATGDGTTGGTQLSTDQRGTGFARILNGTVDIGAFEGFVEAPSLVVTTASDVVDNTDFLTSLREAIAFANLTPDTLDEITFGGDGTGGTTNFTDAIPDVITLGGTQLTISSDITINGPSADLLTVSGDDASRVFNIANGDHDVTFDSLTIADGFTNTVADGAGILNTSSGMIQLLNGAVVDNTSGSDGGGILSSNGTLLIRDSRFAGNSSHAFGGAIRVNAIGISSTLVVERSTFENNTSTLNGSGGIHLNAVNSGSITATISDSTFVGNTASTSPSGLGGAIENRQFGSGSAVTTIINSTFSGNSARRGGAIYNNEGTLTVINSTVVNNDATGGASPDGGGILTTNTNLTLVNSIVAGNTTGGATPDDISGTIDTTNSASNIVGDAGSAGGLTDGTNNNQVSVLITDVIDTTLANTGGATPDDISGTIDTTNSASNIVGDAGSAGGLTDGTNNNQVSVLITDVIDTTLANNGGPTLTHALMIDTTNSASNIVGDAGSAGGLTDGTNNNQVSVLITDVIDTTLANNGGPTLTHALIAGSPAINAGDNALATGDGTTGGTQLSTDQRGTGFDRIIGDTVDIGAFESSVPRISVSLANGVDTAFPGELIFYDVDLQGSSEIVDFTVTVNGITYDNLPAGVFSVPVDAPTTPGPFTTTIQVDGNYIDGTTPKTVEEALIVETQILSPAEVNLSLSTNSGAEADETEITVTAMADSTVVGDQWVNLGVSNGAITAGDYSLTDDDPNTSGIQILIPDGQSSGSVTFTVTDDDLVEALETATLTISAPSSGLTLGSTPIQDIQITDNDFATLSIEAAEILEGDSGTTLLEFTVTLDGKLSEGISPGYETVDGSASGGFVTGSDFQPADTHVQFDPSNSATQQKTFTITINGDTDVEQDETFFVDLSPQFGTGGQDIRVVPGKGRATGTILNDDVQTGPQLFFKEVLDERVWLGVNDISPDGIIVFAWGTETGETYLPQYGVTLGIANATLISLAEGGADGTTSGIIPIPFTPEGQAYLFQAFEMAPNPQVTNVLPLNIAGSPVVVMPNNAAPEPVAELPNFTATVGKPFEFDIADDPFVDPDSETPLFYNARQTDGSPLPEWLDFDPANLSFHSNAIPESGQWSITVTATDRGTPVQFSSTTFVLRAIADRSVWQNRSEAVDVNGDGNTTPVDALIVLNHLNSVDDTALSAQRADGEFQIDVNGDHQVTPIDALRVLNWLNQSTAASNVLVAPSGEYHGDEEEHAESANLNDAAFANAPKIGSLDSFSVATAFSPVHDGANVDEVDDQDDQQESKEEYEERVDKIFADVF
ncbi:Calx-beta domain protein [Rosistilla ulvae]|uniref:Calx-beta domain protein n=1 Tax=Rosistilla ulvae TaxID=1930277 RepID=A0A517M2E3_9BACT|nr:choice-of-anchor Q domain-containing protein [Rosistilla ulvae]QDS89046.1 Calx-beta domain protein [Rosistilla ulvae]